MLAGERRQAILSLIMRSGSARTGDLATRFMVSDQTIRRDLQELEDMGLISKQHGGGILANYEGVAYRERAVLRSEEKARIAREAVKRVAPGMSVAIGPGTTTNEIARLLNGTDVRVVTNSVAVARALSTPPTDVQITGGNYRPESELVTGEWALGNLDDSFVDMSFLGVSGIDADSAYTVTEADEAAVLRHFIRIAKSSVLVADSSKFQRIAKVTVAPLQAVHTLITDAGIPASARRLLESQGVEVVIVGSGNTAAEDP